MEGNGFNQNAAGFRLGISISKFPLDFASEVPVAMVKLIFKRERLRARMENVPTTCDLLGRYIRLLRSHCFGRHGSVRKAFPHRRSISLRGGPLGMYVGRSPRPYLCFRLSALWKGLHREMVVRQFFAVPVKCAHCGLQRAPSALSVFRSGR